MSTASARVADWLADTRDWIERELERALASVADAPARLDEALRYALLGGGKRLRPALVRMACRQFGGKDQDAAAAAAAVEMVHTYSLVHDDLPCMDDDELRRGRPTCHVVYGEALAVLVGDGLQALAFEWLGRAPAAVAGELVHVLARGSGVTGMVGGQTLDLASSAGEVGAPEVTRIHRLKTAALIASAVELGVVAAGRIDPRDAARRDMRAYGEALGLLFQAVDDLLDVTGDAGTLGKTPGKDEAGGKATLVAALGLEGARAEAQRLAEEARVRASEAGCGPTDLALEMVDALLTRSR